MRKADTWTPTRGFQSIEDKLRTGGHGSAANIVNTWRSGGADAWNAGNYNGEFLWVDSQTSKVDHKPLYAAGSVSEVGAVVIDKAGKSTLISKDEAHIRASQEMNADPTTIDIEEFDVGYLIWKPPPAARGYDSSTGDRGGAYLVVDKGTGDTSAWPLLDSDLITDQFRQAKRGEEVGWSTRAETEQSTLCRLIRRAL